MTILDALVVSVTGIFVVMIELGLLAVIVITLSKIVGKIDNLKITLEHGRKSFEEKNKPEKVIGNTEKKVDPNIENNISIEDEIAVIMAVACEESGMPLEEIVFKSISEIK